jgi:hypothetical protein
MTDMSACLGHSLGTELLLLFLFTLNLAIESLLELNLSFGEKQEEMDSDKNHFNCIIYSILKK